MTVNCKPQVNLVTWSRRERGPQVKERGVGRGEEQHTGGLMAVGS